MVGIDEVGRGCLAGPLLVIAARGIGSLPEGLDDSKLLTRKKRLELFKLLILSCEFGEGWVSAAEIDRLGLGGAMRLGIRRSLQNIKAGLDEQIVLDGQVNYVPAEYKNSSCQIKADRHIALVSAASIYGKVTRDKFMWQLRTSYPGYGFESHVGYGTRSHLQALKSKGALTGIHRYSFKPIRVLSESL